MERLLLARSQAFWVIVGILALVATATVFFVAIRTATPPQVQAREFAMTIPLSSPGDVQAGQIALGQAGAGDGRSATLFWSVPEAEAPFRSGLLLMVLASILIVVYGLIYPAIAAGADEQAKSFVEKLIIPALGCVLFGFGASAHAAEAETRENIRLVSQGLPPALSLPNGQRSAYILRLGDTSTASTRELQASIDRLTRELETDRHNPAIANLSAGDRTAILTEIGNVQAEIREGASITDARRIYEDRRLRAQLGQAFTQSQQALVQLRGLVAASNTQSATLMGRLNDSQRELLCAVLSGQDVAELTEREMAVVRMNQSQARDRENILTRTWLEIIGRHRSAQEIEGAALRAAIGDERRLAEARRLCMTSSARPG